MRKLSAEVTNRELSPYDLKPNYQITRTTSKGILTMSGLPPKTRHYKSPSSTPTNSPMLLKDSFSDISHSFSDTKDTKSKDQIYYLHQKLMIQEKRIQLLEEENKRLNSIKTSDFWEKELVKRNDEVRKLENQLKYFIEISNQSVFDDKQLELIEKDKRILQLEKESIEDKNKIKGLEESLMVKDNELKKSKQINNNLLKKEECEILMQQIQELEISLEYHAEVNKKLKEENEKLVQGAQMGSLMYFCQDIHKIKREMNKLVTLMKDFIEGKEITLKYLLGLEPDIKAEPLKQISQDLQSIKSDLNTVLGLISDIHADQYANVVCRNQ